jgi:hypothetical protein
MPAGRPDRYVGGMCSAGGAEVCCSSLLRRRITPEKAPVFTNIEERIEEMAIANDGSAVRRSLAWPLPRFVQVVAYRKLTSG